MDGWPTAAAVPAQATEYWPSQQSTCSWLNSWAGTEGANAEPAAKRTATEASADQCTPDVKGTASGGARSFNRFGTKDPKAAENAVRQLRKLGVAVKVTLADVAGCDHALQQLRENIELPMRKPKVFSTLGVAPPIGSLMYGPSGCGKTLIARALGNELNLHVVTVDAPSLVTDLLGESELVLRAAFAEAAKNQPALVFIEQLDAVAPKRGRDSGASVESRIVSTLLSCMDEVHAGWMPPRSPKDDGDDSAPWAPKRVCVLAATRNINSIDPALRRAGRFEREVCVRCPDAAGRLEMLQVMTRDMCLDDDVDLAVVADEAQGHVGADLAALCRHAGLACIREAISKDISKYKKDGSGTGWDAQKLEALKAASVLQRSVSMASTDDPSTATSLAVAQRHFTEAAYRIGCPSALREHIGSGDRGTGVSGRLKWADVGGIDAQRRDVEELVSYPLLHHDKFKRLGVRPPKGVLLYGPPGVGKTLLARVVASECNCNLITVNGPELLSPYVGQSEARLRELFAAARQSAPCVLFLDEIDAMAQRRGGIGGPGGRSQGGQAADRLLNQLLVETDGMDSGGSDGGKVVILIGATSRPEAIDGALLRPGRLDQLLYIPLPNCQSDRMDILVAVTRSMPLCKSSTPNGESAMEGAAEADVVRLDDIAAQTEGFSGADLRELCQQAGEIALTESIARTTEDTVDDSDADEDAVDDVLDVVCHRHFEEALLSTRRSVSDAEAARYDRLCQSLRSGEAMPPPPEEEAVPPPEAVVGPPAPGSPAEIAGRPVVDGGMEAHLRKRRAPGVPLAPSAAETGMAMEEDIRPDSGEPALDAAAGGGGGGGAAAAAAGGGGGGGETIGQASEALAQEIGLLKASIGMVNSRLKELKSKAENDEAFVNFAHTWLQEQQLRGSASGTSDQQLAAQVGAFAAGVGRAVEFLTAQEEAETEEVTEDVAA